MKRNHTGHRVGEWHQRARLTDAQVVNVREAYRMVQSYAKVARFFGCGASTVRDIVQYRTRASA